MDINKLLLTLPVQFVCRRVPPPACRGSSPGEPQGLGPGHGPAGWGSRCAGSNRPNCGLFGRPRGPLHSTRHTCRLAEASRHRHRHSPSCTLYSPASLNHSRRACRRPYPRPRRKVAVAKDRSRIHAPPAEVLAVCLCPLLVLRIPFKLTKIAARTGSGCSLCSAAPHFQPLPLHSPLTRLRVNSGPLLANFLFTPRVFPPRLVLRVWLIYHRRAEMRKKKKKKRRQEGKEG